MEPVSNVKELLEQFNQLINLPFDYSIKRGDYLLKPEMVANFKINLKIGTNKRSDIVVTESFVKNDFLKNSPVLEYKGELYNIIYCRDEREAIYAYISIIKPVKIE